jgi:MFS family permease
MLNARWLAGLGIPKREFFLVFTLLFNAFTWYYMTLVLMEGIPSYLDAFRSVFYIAAIGSSIAGSILSERFRRLHILYFWMVIGTVVPIQLTMVNAMPIAYIAIIFMLLGISFGLGMPSSLAYLAEYTTVENRGRISAIVFLFVNLSAFPLAIMLALVDIATASIILSVWRGMGLALFVLVKPPEQNHTTMHKRTPISAPFRDKAFTLYLIPWLMFGIIDTLEKSLLKDFVGADFYRLTYTLTPLIASFSMLIAGFLSDKIGRKRVVMYGFVSLGVAYAIIGTAPMAQLAWDFYLFVEAVSTGILWITFILILWGDLSTHDSREKYYVIGSMPFLVTAAIPLSLVPLSGFLPVNTAFSLASFFLFLAVLPLMYAPETLPQKRIELQRLRGYLEQAKKLAGKHSGKN